MHIWKRNLEREYDNVKKHLNNNLIQKIIPVSKTKTVVYVEEEKVISKLN